VVRTFLAILLVTGALYAFYLWVKKQRLVPADDNPYLRRLLSLPLGTNKSAQVITLGTDRAYLIGVADNGVNLIAEITDKELLSTLTLYAEEHSAEKPKTFAALLALFTRRAPGTAATSRAAVRGAGAPTETGFAQTETYLRSQLGKLKGEKQ
jgi:flagellar protein FliO/FliZ